MKNFFLLPVICSFLVMNTLVGQNSIISGASYLVYKGNSVTFYTAQGNELQTMRNNKLSIPELRLDPQAPRPQPVMYKIFPFPVAKKGADGFMVKSKHHVMVFYDKNGNRLKPVFDYDIYANTLKIKNSNKVYKLGASFDFQDFPLDVRNAKPGVAWFGDLFC